MVISNGETKVAQYGQWDGYPDGQGVTVLEFLSGEGNIERLKSKFERVRFLDDVIDKEWIEAYDKNAPEWSNQPDNRTPEQIRWFSNYITRDIGADILENIASSEDEKILLKDSSDFLKDGLFCEWAYKIDLDKNILYVYSGGDNPSHQFQINPPPTKELFLAAFKEQEEEY